MRLWICKCGHEVVSEERPQTNGVPIAIKWSDGHVCKLTEVREGIADWASEIYDSEQGA